MSGLRVVRPGAFTTVQDLGRPGHRGLGVPAAGAFDIGSMRLANALAGNPPDAATLEMTLLGGEYVALGPVVAALAGAPMESTIWSGRSPLRPVRLPSSFALAPGDRLIIGGTRRGVRTYLAVHGGFEKATELGSRSSETPLALGDRLMTRPATSPTFWPSEEWLEVASSLLRVVPGPDTTGCPPLDAPLHVGNLADRMGVRLEPEHPLAAAPPDPDRLSAPVAVGSIQWTGSCWIALGVAGGTIGGYPTVATVIRADLDRLGQLRPGDSVQFLTVTHNEAVTLARESHDARYRRDLNLRSAALGVIRPADA